MKYKVGDIWQSEYLQMEIVEILPRGEARIKWLDNDREAIISIENNPPLEKFKKLSKLELTLR